MSCLGFYTCIVIFLQCHAVPYTFLQKLAEQTRLQRCHFPAHPYIKSATALSNDACSAIDTGDTKSMLIFHNLKIHDAVEAHSCIDIVAKFTDEQYTTKQLTKTLGSKCPAVD